MMFKLILCFSVFVVALGKPQFGFFPRRGGGRIVGGEETTIEECPYQVSFRYYGEHMCGGSIIDENTIVTAAHCTDGLRAARMSVMVGSKYVTRGEVHEVAEYIQHPSYDDETTDFDVSILKLTTPLKFSSQVKPIALQDYDVDVEPGTVAKVSGWGGLYEGDEDTPIILREVDVDVISEEECKNSYTPSRITPRMLCCKRAGKDSCQGDSGGPLVADNKLIGIVSWGIGCARPKYPGIYSKVSNLRRWIDQNK